MSQELTPVAQQIDGEIIPTVQTPVVTQLSNAHIEITIDGQRIPTEKKECGISCECICVLFVAFSFTLLGIYIFLGRFLFRN
jgi:hypothetical protein